MDLGVAGKTAIVTGGSTGLGRAAAEALAAEGVNLVLFSRRKEPLKVAADEIRSRFEVDVAEFPGDMCDKADVKRLGQFVDGRGDGPDILVLNTGRPPSPMREVLDETDDERWEAAYRTQLWSGILVLREITPRLIARKWGRIVAITSATVKQPMLLHGLSTVYRSGLTGFLKQLANETATLGVTVNSICPASIETASLKASYDLKERAARVPMKRLGRPEELGAAVAFLASDKAGFITGASIQIDGGQTASLI